MINVSNTPFKIVAYANDGGVWNKEGDIRYLCYGCAMMVVMKLRNTLARAMVELIIDYGL